MVNHKSLSRELVYSGRIGYCANELPSKLGRLVTPDRSPNKRSGQSSNSKFRRQLIQFSKRSRAPPASQPIEEQVQSEVLSKRPYAERELQD